MGAGDWNDGMNRVGIEGKGESVWLGFFLYDILQRFASLADRRRMTQSRPCVVARRCVCKTISKPPPGTANGTGEDILTMALPRVKASQDCRIDAIAQSWSVLSGAVSRERSELAMQALDKYRWITRAD